MDADLKQNTDKYFFNKKRTYVQLVNKQTNIVKRFVASHVHSGANNANPLVAQQTQPACIINLQYICSTFIAALSNRHAR